MANPSSGASPGMLPPPGTASVAAESLLKKSWRISNALANRHPVVWAILNGVVMAGPMIADLIMDDVETATGGRGQPPKQLPELVDDMVMDENLANVVADIVAKNLPNGEDFLGKLPSKILKQIPGKVVTVLQERTQKRRKALDSTSAVKYQQDVPGHQLAMENVKEVADLFGARTGDRIRDLHLSLRTFINTSSEDVNGAIRLMETAK